MRITAALLVAFTLLVAFALESGKPQAQSAVALSGQVSSAEEGVMEGVVVSAKRDGSTITVSVVTDAQGRYAFPASRLDPKTGQYVEYQLPKTTNIRRVFVDNSTTPVTFWVGSNHGASIVKLEPLD